MTKLAERLCLNLTDTFSCYIKFLTNFLQSSGTSIVQAKTQAQYFLLSVCQCAQNLYQLLFQQSKCCCICRYRYIVILNKVSKVAVLFLTDRCLQRYRLLGDLKDLTYTLYRHIHLFCNFFRRRFTSKLLQ